MDNLLEILFGLIKFDMQQIQSYRDTILNISILSIGASFAISAFIYGKDNRISTTNRNTILLTTNVGLIIILIVVGYFYISGLDGSRGALEMREIALKQHIDKGLLISADSLYPNPTNYKNTQSSGLEKMPLLLSSLLIMIKTMIEILFFRRKVDDSMDAPPSSNGSASQCFKSSKAK